MNVSARTCSNKARIFETKSQMRKIQTALERSRRDAPETVPLTLFSRPVTSQEGQTKIKQGQSGTDYIGELHVRRSLYLRN